MNRTISTRSDDTTPEAEWKQIELLRAVSPARRAHQAFSLSADVISAARRALLRVRPLASASDRDVEFVEVHYGPELAAAVRAEFTRRGR
ncbi:MAG TPA: hypothetical protein VH436_36320 [Vicinamibacterales bacterium]|jgi:hypothetical protein